MSAASWSSTTPACPRHACPFDLRYRGPDGQVYQSLASLRPVAGRILMFPPWLLQSVHPYHGTKERISVAMNANVIAQQRTM